MEVVECMCSQQHLKKTHDYNDNIIITFNICIVSVCVYLCILRVYLSVVWLSQFAWSFV